MAMPLVGSSTRRRQTGHHADYLPVTLPDRRRSTTIDIDRLLAVGVLDFDSGSGALGQAGYAITGSGAGGAGGQYVFAGLEELDDIIAGWEALYVRIGTGAQSSRGLSG
jgi:hypothetical protein